MGRSSNYCSEYCCPVEDTAKDTKDSFYEEAESVFNTFHTYNMKILFGDFNEDGGREI